MVLLAWSAALAADPADEPEVVEVWGDRFARWDHRWYVETEVVLPEAIRLYGWVDHEMDLRAVQVRAVLDCDRDFVQTAEVMQVHCDIEDIGLVARPTKPGPHDDAILRESDATLTEASIQLQVSAAGGVPDVDLEGVSWHDERTRLRAEQLRQLMSRAILPFHLQIPAPVRDGEQWYENGSRLMSMPSKTGSQAGMEVAHFLDELDENWFVVQSIGKAAVRPSWRGETPIDTFALDFTGVALIRRTDGVMTERVWSVEGGMTASSVHALSNLRYVHSGRLRILGSADHPNCGVTAVTGPPGSDRAAWVPLPP